MKLSSVCYFGALDLATRKLILGWIEKNEQALYSPRMPLHPVGVYFSPKSRDYNTKEFLPSYRGALVLLIQQHWPLQVVTPRTLAEFHGQTLVLPSVSVLNETERQEIKTYVAQGGRLVVLGEDSSGIPQSPQKIVLSSDPAREYYNALEAEFAAGSANPPQELLNALGANDGIQLDAPPTVAANFATVNGAPRFYLANFGGLVPGMVAVPTPVNSIHIRVPAAMGSSLSYSSVSRRNANCARRKARGSSRIHAATAGAWRCGVGHEREMRKQLCGWLTVAGLALAFPALSSNAESQTSNLTSQATQVEHNNGKNLFETTCAVCHGLDGAGGEHAPTIGRGSAAKSKSDSELARILRDGIPGKGMPPFNSLGDLKLGSILDYLRLLQAKNETRSAAGNPVHGQQIFFGKGGCANCHAMHGEGRFLSTDLSDFGYDHDANDIRVAIANPQEQQAPPQTLARVMNNSGQQFAGVIRNESNSSLQLQDTDGQFHLFMKYDLLSVERSPVPSMPGDYRNKLSTVEIEDLVSYIVQQSPGSQATDSRSISHKKKNQME